MDRFIKKLWESVSHDTDTLAATFMASLLGTVGAAFFLSWAMDIVHDPTWVSRLAASLGATLIYTGIITGTFYLIVPEKSRKGFKKILNRPD